MPWTLEHRRAKMREYMRKWRANNRDKYRKRDRESKKFRYHNDPEYRQKLRERAEKRLKSDAYKIWWKKMGPKICERSRARRKNFPEKSREYWRSYFHRNKDKILAARAKWLKTPAGKADFCARASLRRAIQKKASIGADLSLIKAMYLHVKYANTVQCHWCKRPIPKGQRAIDHIIPLSRGGRHSIENLVAACKPCNSSKWAATPDEWEKRRSKPGWRPSKRKRK